jgi:hypothetical protein
MIYQLAVRIDSTSAHKCVIGRLFSGFVVVVVKGTVQ